MSDGIVLMGLAGSGKTTIGRRLADVLGRSFLDLDEEIMATTGRSAAEHIEADGEPAFRDVERRALEAACRIKGAVIAVGGGTPLDPLNRWLLAAYGRRIHLDVPVEVVVRRLSVAGPRRPLLGDDALGALRRQAQERAPMYRASDVTLDASPPPEVVTAAAVRALSAPPASGWRPLYDAPFARHHAVGPTSGRLLLGVGLDRRALDDALAAFGSRPRWLVADRGALAGVGPRPADVGGDGAHERLVLPGGSRAKRIGTLARVLEWLTDRRAERNDPLLALGGGAVGDLAALAAALHQRGMPLVHLPTTWLAQADSSIGGKAAVDLPRAKNAVGTFWPAWLVISDERFLDSLSRARRRDGMAECLKAGLIADPDLFALVEQRGSAAIAGRDDAARHAILERAIRVKLAIVDRDPYEMGERRSLNLGHTLGHALEAASDFRLSHGAAVALGIRAVAAISVRRGADPGLASRIDQVLVGLGFSLRTHVDRAAVREALTRDKKRDGRAQRWILSMAVGRVVEVADVSEPELQHALEVIAE